MLNKIRIASDNLLARLFFAIIAFAFIGFGAKDIIQTNHHSNLVTFSDLKPISEQDFLRSKSIYIDQIQRQNNIYLTLENIQEYGINNHVLKKLILDRGLDYLLKLYQFDISKSTNLEYLKQIPAFQNSNRTFDINIFKNIQARSGVSEIDFIAENKQQLLKSKFLEIFYNSLPVPKDFSDQVLNYLANERKVEIYKLNLNNDKNITFPKFTDDLLKQYYQDNLNLFKKPETRSFNYVSLPLATITSNLDKNLKDSEIENFYHENISQFNGKSYQLIKNEVKAKYLNTLAKKTANSLIKEIEDGVAAGSSLDEIQEKFNLPSKLTLNQISPGYSEHNDQITQKIIKYGFELQDQELSYPIELEDGGLIIIENTKILKERLPEFNEIKDEVKQAWINAQKLHENLKLMNKFSKSNENLNLYPFIQKENRSFIRANLEKETKFPSNLLNQIFKLSAGKKTEVIQFKNYAYFAHIRSSTINTSKLMDLKKTLSEKAIEGKIKEGVFEELLQNCLQKNNMKIYEQSKVFRQ